MTEGNEEFDFDAVDWSKLEHNFAADEDGNVPPQHVHRQTISPEMLAKRLLWDVTPCELATEVARALGLPPTSDEVEKMEHRESHRRLMGASPLAPFIQPMASEATSAVLGAIMVTHDMSVEADGEIIAESAERLLPVVSQASYAIVANLIDMGLLHLPHGAIIIGESQ